MPELPDVEVFKRVLDQALHKEVTAVHLHDPKGLLTGVSPSTLRRRLSGHELASTLRRGKHLLAEIDGDGDGWLRLHFGMTGSLSELGGEDDLPEHTRLVLDLEDGRRVAYNDMRRFGEIGLVEDPVAFFEERELGPDALDDLDLDAFRDRLGGRRGAIKSTLMNQKLLAGIGNIYADEILFQARLHPKAPVEQLRDETVNCLHRTMRRVLRKAIGLRAQPSDMPASWIIPRRGKDGSCPRCGRNLATTQVGGRRAYYCPRHQRRKT